MAGFSSIDIGVFLGYTFAIFGVAFWASRDRHNHDKNTEDYFLAGKTLPWWAIGASFIASNISAEQFIGMSGSGFSMGLAIAAYEWMAAATLLIVAQWFIPIFLQKGVYTMPQFLLLRFDERVRIGMAFYWAALYVLVNLTAVLYLGALSLETALGLPWHWGLVGLALFSVAYSLYGGLSAVAWTDVIQVFFLVLGGLVCSYLALDWVSAHQGAWAGFLRLWQQYPQKFELILPPQNPFYNDLPGITVLLGGMWIANLSYWGCNQYITQRALAARSLSEARYGILFAAGLKLLMPILVVLPGMAVYDLYYSGQSFFVQTLGATPQTLRPDRAYPALMSLVPTSLKGIVLAALLGAIVSSISSMMNSTATIFMMDIYKNLIHPKATEAHLVRGGRWVSLAAVAIAALLAPLLGSFQQVFQYIQEFTGFISPAVVAIFLFGLFWKPTTANAALAAVVATFPITIALKYGLPGLPFLDRMSLVFLALAYLMMLVTIWDKPLSLAVKQRLTIQAFFPLLPIALFGIRGWLWTDSVLDIRFPIGKSLMHFLAVFGLLTSLGMLRSLPPASNAFQWSKRLSLTTFAYKFWAGFILLVLVALYVFLH
jgi:SSS family solute:Na+ symporter